ncbi:MAG TPA: hypothetical protein VH951_11140 [Dehalococcoidia bacterium]
MASTDSGSAPPLHAATLAAPATPDSFFREVYGFVTMPAPAVEPPLTRDRMIELVRETWPEDPDRATRILLCESGAGDDPGTYDLDAPNGGPMQISHYTWAAYFHDGFGWEWQQVVDDIHIHLAAARIIYDRAGGWSAWRC